MFILCLWRWYGRYVSPPARAGQSREDNQLSVPRRRGRVYHGGCWRVSIEMVRLADKQSGWAPVVARLYFQRREADVCPKLDPASGKRLWYLDVGEWRCCNLEAAQQGRDYDAVSLDGNQ